MTTIIVVSDTHNNKVSLENLIPIFDESNYIIHLGDLATDISFLKVIYKDKLILIKGNCDYDSSIPKEKILQIEGVKMFCCHGDNYFVKNGLDNIKKKCIEVGANLCLYGHTHTSSIIKEGKLMLVNPGARSYTKAEKSYAYIVIDKEKIISKIINK